MAMGTAASLCTTSVRGPGQKLPASRRTSGEEGLCDFRQASQFSQQDRQGLGCVSPFGRIDPLDRRRIKCHRPDAVDRIGRERHQPAAAQNVESAGDCLRSER